MAPKKQPKIAPNDATADLATDPTTGTTPDKMPEKTPDKTAKKGASKTESKTESKGKSKDAPRKTIKKTRTTGTRTPSSYVLFSMEYRKKVSGEQPDLTLGEVSKKCGEAWSQLSADEKSVWKSKADDLKKERAATLVPDQEAAVPREKRKPSSYLCFSIEYRKKVIEEEPSLSLGEVSKRCGAAWKSMSDADKQLWKDKAANI